MYKIKKCYDVENRRPFWSIQTLDGEPTGYLIYNEEFAKKVLKSLNKNLGE